ncbi:hypothetical protein CH337_18270 [Rhodoblastus acidophilus]|nr:hypothetical protein CKO16_20655 [Rhodoblastus acidophilus]RAI17041.1 hypothetical protein CH337_18270 [Rhodoblastus acidophilus]
MDRAVALKAAANYVQAKRAAKMPPMSLRNFLHPDSFRAWENKTCGDKVFVIRDTDAWRAWVSYSGRSFPPFKRIVDGKPVEGWFFNSLYPPSRALAQNVAR